jgi:hypothetical protein
MRRNYFHASASQVQPNGRSDQHSDDHHGGSGMMRCYLSHASASAAHQIIATPSTISVAASAHTRSG